MAFLAAVPALASAAGAAGAGASALGAGAGAAGAAGAGSGLAGMAASAAPALMAGAGGGKGGKGGAMPSPVTAPELPKGPDMMAMGQQMMAAQPQALKQVDPLAAPGPIDDPLADLSDEERKILDSMGGGQEGGSNWQQYERPLASTASGLMSSQGIGLQGLMGMAQAQNEYKKKAGLIPRGLMGGY